MTVHAGNQNAAGLHLHDVGMHLQLLVVGFALFDYCNKCHNQITALETLQRYRITHSMMNRETAVCFHQLRLPTANEATRSPLSTPHSTSTQLCISQGRCLRAQVSGNGE